VVHQVVVSGGVGGGGDQHVTARRVSALDGSRHECGPHPELVSAVTVESRLSNNHLRYQ